MRKKFRSKKALQSVNKLDKSSYVVRMTVLKIITLKSDRVKRQPSYESVNLWNQPGHKFACDKPDAWIDDEGFRASQSSETGTRSVDRITENRAEVEIDLPRPFLFV